MEEGHAASGSATGATRRGRGAGAGKAKLGRRGASETAAGAKFDLARGGYEYAEILTYLSSPPEHALKGVGPKRAQQLTKLGSCWAGRGGGMGSPSLFFLFAGLVSNASIVNHFCHDHV